MCRCNSKYSVVVLLDKDKTPTDNDSNKRVIYECCYRLDRYSLFTIYTLVGLVSLLRLPLVLDYQYLFGYSLSVLTCGTYDKEANLQ